MTDSAGLLIDRLADAHAQVTDSGWRRMHGFRARFDRITRQVRSSGRDRSAVEETLFFAGEATEPEQSGTVPGAIASGRRAAVRILK